MQKMVGDGANTEEEVSQQKLQLRVAHILEQKDASHAYQSRSPPCRRQEHGRSRSNPGRV